ncbi:chloride channel protein [Pseudonocardia kujensis]|uniref:chloride channel protein n=1 Tax=Pseudonocardia kujensis TaxID=1128675 RepID=UPI001E653153|nr:chloride channel protein [Pseudonocardia kujensis]MCE0766345.1 chloride channel protein [Pseudonocardia kujensis]
MGIGRSGRRGEERPSERLRQPQPLLRRRIASGRGAMDQPNVTGDGDVPLTVRFWLVVVLTGVGAGLFGIVLMLLLGTVARLAFGPGADVDFLAAVERASWLRRVLPLLVAGVIGGIGWFLLRRHVPGRSDVDDAVWTGDGRLGFRRSAGSSVLSVTVVGLGASLGREAAPKLMAGVCGSLLAGWAGLTTPQRRLLVACGAGAGLACVYNVPLGGALFTAEVLVGAVRLPVMLPALACSAVATLTAWIGLPSGPIYPGVPDFAFSASALVWAIPAGVLIGLLAVLFVRLIAWVSHRVPRGRVALVAPLAAFAVLAALGLAFPQLYGNGQDIAAQAFAGIGPLWLFAALFVLKPLVTVLCLGSGASGGLFTPTLATGAALGACLGGAWSLLWPGTPVGAYAMIGAAAMIGAGMQAPLAGLALVLELTHSGFGLMVPMMVATLVATAVSRWVDGYSIYSARLAERVTPVGSGPNR